MSQQDYQQFMEQWRQQQRALDAGGFEALCDVCGEPTTAACPGCAAPTCEGCRDTYEGLCGDCAS